MSLFKRLRLKTKKTLIQVYGPAELHEEHDPIVQVDKEHAQELQAEQGAQADEAVAEAPSDDRG